MDFAPTDIAQPYGNVTSDLWIGRMQHMGETTILVVDDNESFLNALNVVLRKDGYRTTATCDWTEALTIVRQTPISLVILDVHMPLVGGLTALREIKRANPDLPVIVMIASTSEETKRRALDSGADSYLEKPFDVDILRKVVRKMLPG